MPTAPQHDASQYAADLAQWWYAQAHQWTQFQIGVCIAGGLAGLLLVWLFCRSVADRKAQSTLPAPIDSTRTNNYQFALLLKEMSAMTQAIDNQTAQIAQNVKDEQAAIVAQNNAAAAIQSLQAQVTALQTQVKAQAGDEAALPPLTQQLATSDGALAQSTAALVAATPPA